MAGNAAAYDWQTLPEEAPSPEDNPTTEEKVELGKKLFFDPRYSATGTVSCNTCHNVMEGGDDGRPTSMGVHGKTGPRNAPTVWNSAFHASQFWDGRAATLEEQAKGPVLAEVEMGVEALEVALERVASIPGYRDMFKEAFADDEEPVSVENAAKAVAAFERTLITPNSPYDRYVQGDTDALTEQQVRGMKTFNEVGCTSCHSGPNFSGNQLKQEKGEGVYQKFPAFSDNEYVEKYHLTDDKGRAKATGDEADAHMYKVPTLRNVALTAPYFHNGLVETLPEAVRVMAKTQLNRDLTEQQVADIVAFLEGLTGEFPEMTMPRLPSKSGESIVPATAADEYEGDGGGH
nr:cytochrome-c peroxidase [Thiohalorhabdus denitrificans]